MHFGPQKLSKRDYFFSQPHQPFFLLGMVNAVIFMALFVVAYKGIVATNALFLHSYSMIFLIFTNFFFGFLYTTFPRFSGTPPIDARRYLIVFSFDFFASLSFLVGVWFEVAWYVAILLMAVSFAMTLKIFYEIYRRCALPKRDQYWIIVALGVGAMSNLLFLLSLVPCRCQTIFYDTAVNFGIYLYALFLAFVVAFRMVPFFSHRMDWEKNNLLHLQIFVLFLLHSFLSGLYPKGLFALDLIAALLIGYELKKIALPFPNREPLLWILHIALFWLALGLLLGGVVEFFESFFGWYSFKLPLHLLALGFLFTILIGFGTRVTLGHSGNMLRVDRAGVVLFYFTQVVLVGRILFSFAASFGHITPAFDISATLWMVVIVAWLWRYGAILVFGKRQ